MLPRRDRGAGALSLPPERTRVKLSVGEILGESWALYTRNSGRLIAVAAIVFGFLSLVNAVIDSFGSTPIALLLVSVAIAIVGVFWMQGALVIVVQDLRDGRTTPSIGDVFQRVEPRLWTLIGAGILAAVGIGVGLILLVVPGLVLLTYWSMITPVVVLERRAALPSFSRSAALVSGNGLRVFAVIAVTVIGSSIVSAVIFALLSPLPPFFDLYIAGVVANSVTVPYVALAWTLVYYDLRAGKPAVSG